MNHHCRLQINGDVLFDSNVANNGAGIYINNQSSVIFGENSDVKFINNLVVHSGAAIFVNNQSSVLFDNNSIGAFINNEAINGIIYRAEVSSNITFKAICNVTFSNNSATQYGASIYSTDNSHITFKNNSTVTFIGNAANNGGAVALYNSSTATIKEHSNLTFSNNTSKNSGGALYFTDHCHFHFTDNSITLFVGNTAKDYGGAIQSAFNSSVRFKKNSKILFEDNRATFGETLHARGNSLVAIKSDVTINGNTAMWNYGGYLTNTIDDIHIDANGIVRCNDYKEYHICRYAKCFCKNLVDTPSNAAVIISGDVTISSVITLTGIVNISIIGYNSSSILSVNDSGMQFISCKKVTITNLHLHRSEKDTYNGVIKNIKLHNSSNIIIDNCTFQLSNGQLVVLSQVSDVIIKHCKFGGKVKHPHREHGAAIYYSSNNNKFCEDKILIDNCCFIDNSGIKSLIFLENTHACSKKIIIQNSQFYKNHGTCIYLWNQNLLVKGNLHFEDNTAENGASIFVDYYSNLMFGNTSNATFSYNEADISGGAIYLNNWSSVVFENSSQAVF